MTELEYIHVRDLSNVLTAEHALRDMNPEFNGLDPKEHVQVCRILQSWRETLFAKINTESPEKA